MSPLDTKQPAPPEVATPPDPPSEQAVAKFAKVQAVDPGMTTLFGGGYGQYQVRPENFLVSVITHTVVIALILWIFHITIQPAIVRPTNTASIDLAPYIPEHVGHNGGGGGGGDASKLKASAGTPPRVAKQQFAPPVVVKTQKSKLMVAPTVVAADLKYTPTTQVGDPLSKLMVASNGTGVTGGIGSGDGGGVGAGHGGPGVGPGIFHVGNGVSAPQPIFTPEPEFTEEARKAKYQGVVVLSAIVGIDGRVHNARVVRALGMGLDERALQIVKQWKFDPGKKDGRPVAVEMGLEISFNLY